MTDAGLPTVDRDPQSEHRPGPTASARAGAVPGSVAEWEERYSGAEAVWSGQPNVTLVEVVRVLGLTPGRSLDVGCGEGADVIWLARQGWQATGIDVSSTAIARAREAARLAEVTADFSVANLTDWTAQSSDLVTGCFLHTRLPDTRAELLRHLGEQVGLGGRLILISHATVPPWADSHAADAHTAESEGHRHGHDPVLPRDDFALLEAGGAGEWELELAVTRTRPVTGPDGDSVDLDDAVLVARKA